MYISYIHIYYRYACYAMTLGTIGCCTPQCKNLVDYLEKWIHWKMDVPSSNSCQ